MRKGKKGLALAVSVVLIFSTAVSVLLAASKNWSGAMLGDLSQYYETGNSADPGYISTVKGDSGGTSYGIYMFASNAGTPIKYVEWLRNTYTSGNVYRTIGDTLYDAYAYNSAGQYYPGYGSNFNATWKEMAETYPAQFLQSQKDFWEDTQYKSLLQSLEKTYPAFDINDYSIALQNVLWSRSVQHGVEGAYNVVTRALVALDGFTMQDESTLIQAIYAECSRLDQTAASKYMTGTTAEKYGVSGRSMAYYSANSGDVQMSVYRRLHVNEPADALVMLYDNDTGIVVNGVYRLQRSGEPNQLLTATENGMVCLSSGTDFTITHYADDAYTIAAADGQRLTDNGGKISMAAPAASYNQMWIITGKNLLQNRGTGKYLTVSNGTLCTTQAEKDAVSWPRIEQSTILSAGLFYPGCEEGITNKLVAGASSFPVRGIIYSAVPLTKVEVKVTGPQSFTAGAAPNANYYDLWELDDDCTFSTLTEGTYSLTITAAAGKKTVELGKSTFTVSKNTGNISDDETYLVTFMDGKKTVRTTTYHLGDTYGDLPEITTAGFTGWYLSDGTEITANTMVAADNHTVTAKYGTLYTVKFVSDGKTVSTAKLANGELITAPSNPLKPADSSYTYSFSCWKDGDGNKYVSGQTYMGEANITFTAEFKKTAVSAGSGSTGGTGAGTGSGTATAPSVTSGSYLTGISPETPVSSLLAGGYTVYDGAAKVTSGNVATGMTATSGGAGVTIVVTGDVSGDGKITITDVVRLQKYVTGSNNLTAAQARAGDINGDGGITITDVVQAAQVAVGQRIIR